MRGYMSSTYEYLIWNLSPCLHCYSPYCVSDPKVSATFAISLLRRACPLGGSGRGLSIFCLAHVSQRMSEWREGRDGRYYLSGLITTAITLLISRCQGYKRVIKVVQFLPVLYDFYYTVGKGSSWYNTHIAWEIVVFMQYTGNSPSGLHPRAYACVFHKHSVPC